jgi:hypothetical protein
VGQAARPCRCQPSPFAWLGGFRSELHTCFTRRADALFELGDALLCSQTPFPSLPHLSLEPVHQRGWGNVHAALARGRIDTGSCGICWCASCQTPTRWCSPLM